MNIGDVVLSSDGKDKWIITGLNPVKIKVLSVSLFCNYLDKNFEYILTEHVHAKYGNLLYLGEISSNQMKDSCSQVLLYEWKDGLSFDLDS